MGESPPDTRCNYNPALQWPRGGSGVRSYVAADDKDTRRQFQEEAGGRPEVLENEYELVFGVSMVPFGIHSLGIFEKGTAIIQEV